MKRRQTNAFSNSKKSLAKIQRKISVTQIALIVSLSLILAMAGLIINIHFQRDKIDNNLQNISETIATSPILKENDVQNSNVLAQESLLRYLDSLKKSLLDVDVISIVNKNNTRFYHTNHNLIGTEYDGEQPNFNDVSFYIVNTSGPSGLQRRAYSALYDNNGEHVGFIMVIILTENVNASLMPIIVTYSVITLIVIVVELLISSWISGNIKKSLLGYEPDTISAMYLIRDNILESLEEGVIAIDKNSNIIFANNSVVKILDKTNEQELIGQNLSNIKNGLVIKRALIGEERELNIHEQISEDIDVLIDRIPIKNGQETVGTIGILHNRAEYTKLMEDLSGTRYLVDSMRANNHDFTNKLHVILGLIQMQMYDNAISYIENITIVQRATISKIMNTINEPSIAALLIGKTSRASELNVKFILRESSYFSNSDISLPTEVLITIIGNLIENAFESMNEKEYSQYEQKQLLFGIYSKPNALLITVDDTGLGIKKENIGHIFENGFSTKGANRGTGLYQVKTMIDNLGGQITVETQENVGTSFSVSFTKG